MDTVLNSTVGCCNAKLVQRQLRSHKINICCYAEYKVEEIRALEFILLATGKGLPAWEVTSTSKHWDMGERVITFDLLRILAADDKEIRINGTSTTLFLSLRLVQGQVKWVWTWTAYQKWICWGRIFTQSNRNSGERIWFSLIQFRPQKDDTTVGSLSDHLIRKEGRVRVARVISKWTAPQGNLI